MANRNRSRVSLESTFQLNDSLRIIRYCAEVEPRVCNVEK